MSSNEDFIRKNKVENVDDDQNTKLHYAAALGNLEELEKIIASRQKIDPENYLGWTPLMMAVRNGNSAAMNILLQNGADATKSNKFGINVFLISVTCGDIDIVGTILNHLLSGGVSRQCLQKFFSPISLAILFGHSHIFKYLLERSFDPNASTPLTGITPLMFAAAMGHNKAIKRLLQYNADIYAKNCLDKTAPDILQSKHEKVDIGYNAHKQKPPHIPLIFVSTHSTSRSPHLQLTPYQSPMILPQHLRKSSNTKTPNSWSTPGITPIGPQFLPQVFFGPNFSPSQFVSPNISYHSNAFLNQNISPASPFFSPVFPQPMCSHNY